MTKSQIKHKLTFPSDLNCRQISTLKLKNFEIFAENRKQWSVCGKFENGEICWKHISCGLLCLKMANVGCIHSLVKDDDRDVDAEYGEYDIMRSRMMMTHGAFIVGKM